jgi:hypothetical protein
MAPERRLAAIMFTDAVGYTALMAESLTRQRGHLLVEALAGEGIGRSSAPFAF